MQLRKVCNHPYLFDGAEPTPFTDGKKKRNNKWQKEINKWTRNKRNREIEMELIIHFFFFFQF